jgi:spore germination protein YaaH
MRFTIFAMLLLSGCAYHTSVWVSSSPVASQNLGAVAEVNPVWYTLIDNGAIVKRPNAEKPIAARRVVPTIQNRDFDPSLVCAAIGDSDRRRRHVDDLVRLVMAANVDGIDVDYEALPSNIRDEYSSFVTLLASALHARGKSLSITVSAKMSDDDNWPGPGGQDWRVIGRVADSVKIMAYDFHWSTSVAGPIAPVEWLTKIAHYAATTIPARRQFYGLPWYGYDWKGKAAHNVTYDGAMELADFHAAPVTRDLNGELTFRYEDCGDLDDSGACALHEVWFEDAESYRIKTRTLLRGHPWIGGFAMWRAGSEDPGVWIDVADLNRRKIGTRVNASSPE